MAGSVGDELEDNEPERIGEEDKEEEVKEADDLAEEGREGMKIGADAIGAFGMGMREEEEGVERRETDSQEEDCSLIGNMEEIKGEEWNELVEGEE